MVNALNVVAAMLVCDHGLAPHAARFASRSAIDCGMNSLAVRLLGSSLRHSSARAFWAAFEYSTIGRQTGRVTVTGGVVVQADRIDTDRAAKRHVHRCTLMYIDGAAG